MPTANISYVCLECGTPGTACTDKRQFCNSICANKYKRRTLREGAPTGHIVCEFCKEEFPYWQEYDDAFYGGKQKQFCGYKCSNSFIRLQLAAANGDEPVEEVTEEKDRKTESIVNRRRHCFRGKVRCKYYAERWLDRYDSNCDCKEGYTPEDAKEQTASGAYDSMLSGTEYSIGHNYF